MLICQLQIISQHGITLNNIQSTLSIQEINFHAEIEFVSCLIDLSHGSNQQCDMWRPYSKKQLLCVKTMTNCYDSWQQSGCNITKKHKHNVDIINPL